MRSLCVLYWYSALQTSSQIKYQISVCVHVTLGSPDWWWHESYSISQLQAIFDYIAWSQFFSCLNLSWPVTETGYLPPSDGKEAKSFSRCNGAAKKRKQCQCGLTPNSKLPQAQVYPALLTVFDLSPLLLLEVGSSSGLNGQKKETLAVCSASSFG